MGSKRRISGTAVAFIAVLTAGCDGGGRPTAAGGASGGPPATSSGPSGAATVPGSAPAGAVGTVPAPASAPPARTPTAPGPGPAPAPPAGDVPLFRAGAEPVSAADLGSSWREGCPVGPEGLVLLTLAHWDFDGVDQTGRLVVAADQADTVTAIFARLWEQRFPIRRMVPVDAYGASDDASMADDNTSGFNCREAVRFDGVRQWSQHAYGLAIDLNPVENPAVYGDRVLPPEGERYADRALAPSTPGAAFDGGAVVDAFAAGGWSWGGTWSNPDYQHFSLTGR
ncbi:MAG: M15 family metallopeptidase [Acidimicrobiia bacterium]